MSALMTSADGAGLSELLNMLAGVNIFDMYESVDDSYPGLIATIVGLGLILGGPRLARNDSYYYAFMGIYASMALVLVIGFAKSPKHGIIQLSLMSSMGFIWKDDIKRCGLVLWVGLVVVSLTVAWWCGPPQNSRTTVLINAATALTGVLLVWLQALGPFQLLTNLGTLAISNDADTINASLQRLILALILAIAHNSGLLGLIIAWIVPWTVLGELYRKLSWGLFPPTPRQLLSEDQYRDEGERETQRVTALLKEDLRGLTASELVDQVLSKLKDPKGFIDYLANPDGEHVSEDARIAWEDGDHYITTTQDDDGFDVDDDDFDDNDDDDDDDEEEVVYRYSPTPLVQVRQRHPNAVATPYAQAVRSQPRTPNSNRPVYKAATPRAPSSVGRGKGNARQAAATPKPECATYTARQLREMDSGELLDAMAAVGMEARPITATSRPLLIKQVLKKQ